MNKILFRKRRQLNAGLNILLCITLLLTFVSGTFQESIAAVTTSDTIVYGSNSYDFNEIYEINLTQGSSRLLGTLLFGSQAIEQDPETGYIYYFEWLKTADKFAYYDPATGTSTVVRVYTPSPKIYVKRMAFSPEGVLYMMDGNDRLYTIDKHTGNITSLGRATGLVTGDQGATGDMAFAPDGTLYIATYQHLYTLNLSSRVATLLYSDMIVGDGINVWTGLAYCDSMLYASSIEESAGYSGIYSINPNTGQVDFMFSQFVLNDLTSCPASSQPPPPVNQPPQAQDVAVTTSADTPVPITLLASDPDGDPLTFSIQSGPSNGILSGTAPALTYTPNPSFSGSDSFTYRANDGQLDSNLATVTITVTPAPPVNNPPVAQDDSYSINQGGVLNVSAPGVLANDSDPDGDPLSAVLASGTSNGSLNLNPNGSFTYTPNPAFSGSDSFTYRANDGELDSNLGTVTITVIPAPPVNNPPVAQNDSYSVDQGGVLNIGAPGVLANDSDPDGDSLSAILASGTSNGSLSLNPNGSFTYTPNPAFSGSDSFTYRANDGELDSSLATVNITVRAASTGDIIIYGANAYNVNALYEINLTQGSSRKVADLLFGTLAIEQDPTTGYVYYFDWKRTANRLAYWDPATGLSTIVHTYDPAPKINPSRMAFSPDGVLYIMDDRDRLYILDKYTGEITTLGRTTGLETGDWGGTGDMAFAPNGVLFVNTYQSLYTLNLNTRHATLLYSNMISHPDLILWTGLAYCDNMLYASDIQGPEDISALYRIDPNTGQTDFLFWNYQTYNNKDYLNDLSSCPVNSQAFSNPASAESGAASSGSSRSPLTTPSLSDLNPELDSQAQVEAVAGFGILGDSNSDEYRADDNRGREYSAVTFNWMEQLVLRRGLDFGSWGTRPEPRRTGFEYNWARSGATAHSMITGGQHTGLAQQVAQGKVSHALIYIGGNDFHLQNGSYEAIYSGNRSGERLLNKIDSIVANITLAVDTLLSAGDVKIVVVSVADKGQSPEALQLYPDPVGRQRVTDAVNAVNAGIESMASARGIPVVDINAFSSSILDRVDENGNLIVGGAKITMLEPGDEPHHMQLDDWSRHVGTVMSGLVANALFIEPFNSAYGLGISPLTDQEILENAGIASPGNPDLPPPAGEIQFFIPFIRNSS